MVASEERKIAARDKAAKEQGAEDATAKKSAQQTKESESVD